jgi:hypothetical protein
MLRIFSPEKSDGFGRERTRNLGYQRPALITRPPKPLNPLTVKLGRPTNLNVSGDETLPATCGAENNGYIKFLNGTNSCSSIYEWNFTT